MSDTIDGNAGPSGRFVLRISPGLHVALRSAAAEAGLSLNDYCARKLTAPGSVDEPTFEVVQRATQQFGDQLMGILAFGSWARGELTEESDVDLLVVVDAAVPIVRSLYRMWDEAPVSWEARPVEVHIVHPPDAREPPSGLWAEAALEGLLLYERGQDLSRRLVEVRKRIAAGDVSRRFAHGQPYWVGGG